MLLLCPKLLVMKTIVLLLSSLIASLSITYCQEPDIVWQASLGGTQSDEPHFIQPTADQGYVIVGSTLSSDGDVSGNNGYMDVWITKIDQFGALEWSQAYGGTAADYAHCIRDVGDGFIVAGSTNSNDIDVSGNHGYTDFWLFKIDYSGNMLWQKCFGGTSGDYAVSIEQTEDGGYILLGRTDSDDGDVTGKHDYTDIWIVKTDATGNLEWQKCYGGNYIDISFDIKRTSDGGYIFCGSTESMDGDITYNNGFEDFWVVKINASGDIQWQKCYGGTYMEEAHGIIETSDGNYLVVGYVGSGDGDVSFTYGGQDIWLLEIDHDGTLLKEKAFGGTLTENGMSVLQTSDGFLIAGETNSFDGDVAEYNGHRDTWVLMLDHNFVIKWKSSLGGSEYEIGSASVVAVDSGFVIAGESNSPDGDVIGNHGYSDFWIVKLNLPCEQSIFYADMDGDSYGDVDNYAYNCYEMPGYVSDSTDCDDTNPDIHPGALEILNWINDDCDNRMDENPFEHLYGDVSIYIYPNPTDNILYIDVDAKEPIFVDVYDAAGQIVLRRELKKPDNFIDLDIFASGVYMIRIQTSEIDLAVPVVKR